MPVSFIQKYLMKKLDLTNEAEVCTSSLPCQKPEDVWMLFFYVIFKKYIFGFYQVLLLATYGMSSSLFFAEIMKIKMKAKICSRNIQVVFPGALLYSNFFKVLIYVGIILHLLGLIYFLLKTIITITI